MSRPLILGHRGASSVAPENTLAAFERALREGADGVEFDVRLAGDGVPVIIHDATLARTAHKDTAVRAMSSHELSQTNVGTWFNLRFPEKARAEYDHQHVPTLAQFLAMMRSRHAVVLYLEMKCEFKEERELATEVARLLRTHSLLDRTVVESFSLEALRELKRIDPEIKTAALFERKIVRPCPSIKTMLAQAVDCGANEIALHHSLVGMRVVEAARAVNLPTVVWTVDSAVWAERAHRYDLRAVICNDPARMRARFDRLPEGT